MQLQNLNSIKKEISQLDWNFTNAKTTYFTHDIHPYSAKFIPQIANNLIKIISNENDVVLDPFCGSGTTALECLLEKRNSVNTDLNPLSKIIGVAKTSKVNTKIKKELDSIILEIKNQIDKPTTKPQLYDLFPNIPNMSKWFHQNTITELSFLRNKIISIDTTVGKCIFQTILSKTVNQVSNQQEETRYAATEKEIPVNYTYKLFLRNFKKIWSKIEETNSHMDNHNAHFQTVDLRVPISKNSLSLIQKNSIDAVITSPPYPNATDYHLYHRFRLFWLGYDPRDLAKNEIGSHLRHQKEGTGFIDYMKEMELCMKNIYLALKHGKYAAFVIGDGIFNKQVFRSAEELSKIGEKVGFKKIMIQERNIHQTRRSFLKPGRRAKLEKILILQKIDRK
ncbi:MAG: hypothetical protein HOD60_05475 [Candidatus Nitrosopelagicus sp.]|jgi:DNA modification methylase|nr:hypothetical protein [Candidatus Nitrosopelagicus sp.]